MRARGRRLAAVAALGLATALASCSAMEFTAPMPSFTGAGTQASARTEQVFIVSTREGDTGAATTKSSTDGAHFSLATISLPPHHKSGVIERPMWGNPNPNNDFVVLATRELDADEFKLGLRGHDTDCRNCGLSLSR